MGYPQPGADRSAAFRAYVEAFQGYPLPEHPRPYHAVHALARKMNERNAMRRFELHRDEDVTGISGTGVVAEGIQFSDGEVVLRWLSGEWHSTVIWSQGIEAVEAIHGHGGRTFIRWVD